MSYPHRYLCSVLEEMRKSYETYNFAVMKSLIEEAQTLGNRMEAALDQKRDYYKLRNECKELEKKRDKLKKQVAKLEKKSK